MFRSSKGNAVAQPQTPPGRMILPGPRQLRILHDFLIKQCSAVAEETKTCHSRAGRLCRPACAQAHREKAGDFPKNKLACFLGNPQPFLLPGSSPGDLNSFRRILSVIPSAQHRQGEVQDPAGPGSGVRGLKKPPRLSCPGALLSSRKLQAHIVCYFKWRNIAREGARDRWSLVRGSGG